MPEPELSTGHCLYCHAITRGNPPTCKWCHPEQWTTPPQTKGFDVDGSPDEDPRPREAPDA